MSLRLYYYEEQVTLRRWALATNETEVDSCGEWLREGDLLDDAQVVEAEEIHVEEVDDAKAAEISDGVRMLVPGPDGMGLVSKAEALAMLAEARRLFGHP